MSYSRTQPSTEPEMTVGPEKMSDVIESRASAKTWIGERFWDLGGGKRQCTTLAQQHAAVDGTHLRSQRQTVES